MKLASIIICPSLSDMVQKLDTTMVASFAALRSAGRLTSFADVTPQKPAKIKAITDEVFKVIWWDIVLDFSFIFCVIIIYWLRAVLPSSAHLFVLVHTRNLNFAAAGLLLLRNYDVGVDGMETSLSWYLSHAGHAGTFLFWLRMFCSNSIMFDISVQTWPKDLPLQILIAVGYQDKRPSTKNIVAAAWYVLSLTNCTCTSNHRAVKYVSNILCVRASLGQNLWSI